MGIEVTDGEFGGAGRLVLRAVGHVPSGLTERVLFGDLPFSVRNILQKALQRLVGGPRSVRVHFTAGPLAGWDVDCDVGAHAGYSALVFARLSGDGHVYAFEPSPSTFERLQRNVGLNKATI